MAAEAPLTQAIRRIVDLEQEVAHLRVESADEHGDLDIEERRAHLEALLAETPDEAAQRVAATLEELQP